ncbi:M14 family zinc carboxypeptidase [Aerosakkonemataceae cyanobacterium BLCC-F50]|uniref:M14 family zinc carboxypeptidase n=1 Tax=Floridaenema flaviceps BLCC-F50 TaxID=3153642 RepID=A0ABV4Y2N5_9CYAN
MLAQDKILDLLQLLNSDAPSHCHPDELLTQLQKIYNYNPNQIRIEEIGHSRDRHPLYALLIGDTNNKPIIAATGNCHAEEAIGTTTILKLAEAIASQPDFQPILENYSFAFIPQANPDGTLKNWEWLKLDRPTYRDYLRHYYRDNRSEDVEHGIPTPETAQECRPEPEAIAKFYRRFPRISYYVTLHSANIFPGAMFLVSQKPPANISETLRAVTHQQSLSLYEDNDNGMDGFEFIESGFYGIPRFEVMREKMLAGGDPERIKKFKLNSFQLVESECQCPMSLVSELPYFQVMGLDDLTPLADYIPVACDREVLKRKLVDFEQESAKQRMNLLSCLSASNFSSPLMEFYQEKTKWLLGNIAGDRQDCHKVRGCPTLIKDLLEVRIRPLMLEAEVAAMMIRLYCESGENSDCIQSAISYYEETFNNACDRIDKITTIKTVSLADQVKIQAGIILSGLLVS